MDVDRIRNLATLFASTHGAIEVDDQEEWRRVFKAIEAVMAVIDDGRRSSPVASPVAWAVLRPDGTVLDAWITKDAALEFANDLNNAPWLTSGHSVRPLVIAGDEA